MSMEVMACVGAAMVSAIMDCLKVKSTTESPPVD